MYTKEFLIEQAKKATKESHKILVRTHWYTMYGINNKEIEKYFPKEENNGKNKI